MIFPASALTQHIAILGKTGSGKTYAARGIIEGLLDQGARVCIVDPTGAWNGLRSSASGKSAGYPVVIFGGAHADLPLAGAQHGEAIADVIGTSSTAAILDTSLMRIGERTRFFTDFADALLRKNRGPLHLVIDEAHLFAPQGKVNDPQSGAMLSAANNLVSLGRSRGLRIILISQRPAKLHKDSLTQVETLVAMRLIAPQDRKAVKEWIEDNADQEKGREVIESLATLKTGQGWVWAPEIPFLERITFPKIKTFDSGKTPDGSEAKGQFFAPIDREAMAAKLKTVAADAMANDPATLKKRIAELEKLVALKPDAVPADPDALDNEFRRGHATATNAAREAWNALLATLRMRYKNCHDQIFDGAELNIPSSARIPTPRPLSNAPLGKAPAPVKRPAPSSGNGHAHPGISRPQQLILDKLRLLEERSIYPPSRPTLAAFCAVSSTSSGFEKNLSTLKTAGLIEYPTQGVVAFTAEGRAAANITHDDGEPLEQFWLRVVNEPKAKILRALISSHPEELSREELAADAAVSPTSSGFEKNLSTLKTLGAIEYPSPGYVGLTRYVMP